MGSPCSSGSWWFLWFRPTEQIWIIFGNISSNCLTCKHEFLRVSTDLSRFRPVYAPKDFLEVSRYAFYFRWRLSGLTVGFAGSIIPQPFAQVLISLRNPNYNSSEDVSVRSHWGLIQVPLSVRDIPQLVCVCVCLRMCTQRSFCTCASVSIFNCLCVFRCLPETGLPWIKPELWPVGDWWPRSHPSRYSQTIRYLRKYTRLIRVCRLCCEYCSTQKHQQPFPCSLQL